MKPYFETIERQEQLRRVAGLWRGTPFVPHARIRGAGVDCVHLAAEIYRECGHLAQFQPGNYAMDGGFHNPLSQVLTWLDLSPYFTIGTLPARPGDLLCFRIGQSVHHVGVALSARHFLHVMRGSTVTLARTDDPAWSKRLTAVYQPIES